MHELTAREALRLGHNYVGTEHILLGLLAEEQGLAAKALGELRVSQEAAETWILEELAKTS